jgi:hypothetical protein
MGRGECAQAGAAEVGGLGRRSGVIRHRRLRGSAADLAARGGVAAAAECGALVEGVGQRVGVSGPSVHGERGDEAEEEARGIMRLAMPASV